jgi:hypothetical protein
VTTSRVEFKALQNELGTLRESLQDANALQETTSKKLALASKNAAGALADLASAKNYVKSLLTEKALSESRRENHVADAKRAAQQTEDVENEMQKLKKDHLLDLEASAAAVTAEFQAEIAELSQKAGQGQNNASSSSSSSSALQTALDRACDAERSLETTKKRADTLKAALDEANQMAALANERASDAASTAANAVAKAREAQTSAEQEAADARASEERARALSLRNAETEDSRDSKFADLEARLGEAVSQAATARGDASAAREGEAEALRLSVAAEENCVRAAEEARVSKHAAAAATAQATTAEEARRRAQLRCEEVRIGPFPNPGTLFAHTRLTLSFYTQRQKPPPPPRSRRPRLPRKPRQSRASSWKPRWKPRKAEPWRLRQRKRWRWRQQLLLRQEERYQRKVILLIQNAPRLPHPTEALPGRPPAVTTTLPT